MKRLMEYVNGILPFVAAELIQIITVNGLYVVFSYGETLTPTINNLIGFLGVLICGIVFYFWYRIEIRGEDRGSLRKLLSFQMLGPFLALGLGIQYFFTGGLNLLQPYFTELFRDYADRITNLTDGNEIIVILFTVLVAPVTEELIFRGVVLHKTARVIPFLGANLLQAALFGIYHMNIIQGIYAAFVGYILGLIYLKFRNILAPILLHVVINSSAFLALRLPMNSTVYWVSSILGGFVIVTALYRIHPTKE